jgi:hypothetical protein
MVGIDGWHKRVFDWRAPERPHIEWAFEEEQRAAALELFRSAAESVRESRDIDEEHHLRAPKV